MNTIDEKPVQTDNVYPWKTAYPWKRGLMMLILLICFGIGQALLWATTVIQFLWILFDKEPNKLLIRFGKSLSQWLAQTALFLTCATEDKPFPWAEWPSAE